MMGDIKTEAWVLYQSDTHDSRPGPGELKREVISFPDITEDEVLAEPLFGCWEANMAHALERRPVDVCRQRGEEKVVIGNAGVVRVIRKGAAVRSCEEGDVCLLFGNGDLDELGYVKKVWGYDAPGTVGVLAKKVKMRGGQLFPIPQNTAHTLEQWAALSVRYVTAWGNWKAAYGCLRALLPEEELPVPIVWGWGGGTALAQMSLAKLFGCETAMITSRDERITMLEEMGIKPIDRRLFPGLEFDAKKYHSDPKFKEEYLRAENTFLRIVREETNGRGVSIFADYIGYPVTRATLKALGRPGVITTAGWKSGMHIPIVRAIECINWHVHVNTHFARYPDVIAAVKFAEDHSWFPKLTGETYDFDNIPRLAQDFAQGKIADYFPIFRVNPA